VGTTFTVRFAARRLTINMSIDHRIASGFVAGSRLRGAILARMKRAKLTEAEKNRVLAKILRAPELVKRSAKVIPFFKP
jgi:hypothetical protein